MEEGIRSIGRVEMTTIDESESESESESDDDDNSDDADPDDLTGK